jgi:hypothetical protein
MNQFKPSHQFMQLHSIQKLMSNVKKTLLHIDGHERVTCQLAGHGGCHTKYERVSIGYL